ncbi:GumC family protein [Geomonas azotofigens]|uniref:GumC family protein n=1 Tax=Geomonas azotofigens TaxID=2843196 RepID=UPI001C1165B9|nr:Wzz/FepE/Etk N-terminal domain-containing protein [Geomonas azotofigens]MBU5613365.1 lipopolysaccharide biosynthesis protein [Geomonas azotofigens]
MKAEHNIEAQEVDLLELLHVLVKRKMLIIKVCAVTTILGLCYSLTLPDYYCATAKILPPQKEGGGGLSALLGQAGGLAALAGGGFAGSSDLYVGILKSRSVADAVIARMDLVNIYKAKNQEAARRTLEGAVKIQGGKDGIISIVAEDKDPKRAAALANAFVQEIGRTTVRLNLSKVGTERVFLEKRLEIVKKDLQAAEDDLKAFSQRNKIVQVDSQAKASIEEAARLKAEVAGREVQLAVLRSKQTDESPEVKAAQTGIQRLKRELGAVAGSGGGGEGIPAIGNVPNVGLEYSRKLRELKTQEAIFEQLTKQYEAVKINEAKDSSTLQVLDEAVPPWNKSRPRRSLIVFMAAVAGGMVSVVVVFLQELVARMPEEDRRRLEQVRRQLPFGAGT